MSDNARDVASVTDHRSQPRGVLPRATQSWIMVGLAVVILGIIVFTGKPEPTAEAGGRNVTFPARTYSVNGDRRSFALLRPGVDAAGQERVRDLILAAYAETESAVAVSA